MGTSKNVTWQEYNGTDYDILLPQPSVATADRVGGIIADTTDVPYNLQPRYECKISHDTHKLLMPSTISPGMLDSAVPINKGGTGADNKQQAMINLGVSDYQVSGSVINNVATSKYNSGMRKFSQKTLNVEKIELSDQTDDGKWYTHNIQTFFPSFDAGTMSTWKYWNMQIIPVMSSANVMPMFTVLQTGYLSNSKGIPFRLFSTRSITFNPGQLMIVLEVHSDLVSQD